MLPFIGYNAGDYFAHWLSIGKHDASKLPRVFFVNWFRRDDDGSFLWPGFGENSRVLKWIAERIDGTADAVETPIGYVPSPDSLDLEGLDVSRSAVERALAVDVDEWRAELPLIEAWFDKLGDNVPAALRTELDALRARLG
jgi:phosphoenolpyruvate carboxykinase (GTP)